MPDYRRDLKKALEEEGCTFVRYADGSHELWHNPLSKRKFTIPRHVSSRHLANEILKHAGVKIRREQARSQSKFAAVMLGLRFGQAGERKLAASYLADRPRALAALAGHPIEFMRFETILLDPSPAAAALARVSGCPLDELAMARVVRARPPTCHPTMLEIEMIEERERAA